MKNEKPTKEEIRNALNKTVPDVIGPNLRVLFCGINPGLYTAAIGHHFGRPGNRFWKALFEAGFTDHLFDPREEQKLLGLGFGITNLVARATLSAADVATSEFVAGGEKLREKVAVYKPQWVAFVGIQAYRIAFGKPKTILGKQQETIGSAKIWVLPSPSGLNAHYKPKELTKLFEELRLAVEA